MCIAETAIAALQKDKLLPGMGEVGENDAVIPVDHLSADRNAQNEILTVGAGALASGAGAAVVRPKMLTIPVIDQGVEVVGRDKGDVPSLAAVAAIGAAELDKLLAAKAHRAAPAVTTLQVNLALIEELHLRKLKGEQSGRSPFSSWLSRRTAIRRPRPAAEREVPPKHKSGRPAQCET